MSGYRARADPAASQGPGRRIEGSEGSSALPDEGSLMVEALRAVPGNDKHGIPVRRLGPGKPVEVEIL